MSDKPIAPSERLDRFCKIGDDIDTYMRVNRIEHNLNEEELVLHIVWYRLTYHDELSGIYPAHRGWCYVPGDRNKEGYYVRKLHNDNFRNNDIYYVYDSAINEMVNKIEKFVNYKPVWK